MLPKQRQVRVATYEQGISKTPQNYDIHTCLEIELVVCQFVNILPCKFSNNPISEGILDDKKFPCNCRDCSVVILPNSDGTDPRKLAVLRCSKFIFPN